jgi:hypothetical protein
MVLNILYIRCHEPQLRKQATASQDTVPLWEAIAYF